ncbi:basic blue protein-like [Cucurbita pepo subsp. pepo]|uniref:basic blue protein-like n=1 Tax=Cucurbita pepo subsp. pepo TaxID=3664 RepID=UPI000C9D897A|nr:basic blue protein-like [Cucurbita pepo subsp. pepo]XP_023523498.1 basic blue protein-like [Cucurbita pepo subsp. pepo]
MARHEGSSGAVSMSTVAVAMALLLLLLGFEHDNAATTFVVGDSNGWNLGMEGWPNGKVFRAGDILRVRGDLSSTDNLQSASSKNRNRIHQTSQFQHLSFRSSQIMMNLA